MITAEQTKTTSNLIQVRVPAELKARTAELFEKLGTTTSDVIRMMLVRADETKSIPFPVRTTTYPYTSGERIDEVSATLATEGLPPTPQNIQDLKDIETARTTTEKVRQRILSNYRDKTQG